MMTDKPSSELSAPGCNFIQVCNQQSSILIDPWFQCNSNPQSSPITILYPWCSLWFHPQSSLIPICDLWYSLWPDPQSSPILDPWSRLEIACSPLNCETNASLNPINATLLLLLQGSMVDEEPSCFISRQCSPDMKRKILFVKLPPHPSVLYRSAACPFFLMGQRQRCKNFQLFTLRREAEYIKDQLCTNIFHRGQGAKIIWWSITHQPDLAFLLPSKSTMCGTFPKKISWTKRVHFRPKLKNSVKSETKFFCWGFL